MPIKGIMTSARALSFYERWQEVTANNLANASTDGFKFERLTAALQAGQGDAPMPVEKLNLQQGSLRETGRPLDVALEGSGFLVVQTPQGQRLSRGGSLHLDVNGTLVDQNGNPVLGNSGPIVVPDTGQVVISKDGTVAVTDSAADGGVNTGAATTLDTLKVVTVKDPSTLTQEGSGLLVAHASTESVPEGSVTVQQGTVEDPNSDSISGMVDLVSIQRAYSANLDALKAMDSVMDTVAGQIAQSS